jgi:Ca2+-binding EF-hand superfamily protein
MNNISLVKITLAVALATIATFIVNANEIYSFETDLQETTVFADVQEVVGVEGSTVQQKTFAKLLTKFDIDKNGVLSEAELSTSDNEALKTVFKNLDLNEDSNLSLDEFNAF